MAKKQEPKKPAKPKVNQKGWKPKSAIVEKVETPEQGRELIISPNTTMQSVVTKEKIKEWLTMTGKVKDLNPGEVGQFIEIATVFGLNPFKREIHVSVYSKDDPNKRALTIVIGYEVYLKRAERLHNLDGWKCWTTGEGSKLVAHIQIWRKDRKQPFEWEVPYSEAVQTKYGGGANHFWTKMPSLMLKKVCISQGFRLCFPDDLGGIPYTDAEMGAGEYGESEKIVNVEAESSEPIYSQKPDVEDAVTEPVDDVKDNASALRDAVKALNAYTNKSIIASVGKIMQEIKTSTAKLEVFTAWITSAKKQKTIQSIDLLSEILRKPEDDMAAELKKIKEE